MAAPIRNVFTRSNFLQNARKVVPAQFTSKRTASSNRHQENQTPKVTVTPDGSTILCWHPEPEFPYEHTKPIPRRIEELAEGESVLKVQYLLSEKLKYRERGPSMKELSNIFFTSKHQWLPKPEKKYKKVRTPKDRERL